MSTIDPRQARSIANFLKISRAHLGLPERRHFVRTARRRLRWSFLRLALFAGSFGSLFGGAAMAEHNLRSARAPVSTTQLATTDGQARASLEQMP